MIRLVLLILGLCLPVVAQAAPKADLWPRWQEHDPASRVEIDHGRWNAFLSRYVSASADGINRVVYAEVTAADKSLLQSYIRSLGRVAVNGLNRPEQRAYWINLYNALTIKVVLDKYPVSSIRKINISPGFFSTGPWGKKLIEIEGEEVSLDDIEHRILRPIWKDPRLHYAVNCAALGCPSLLRRAFTAANAETLLDKGARDYVNHPRGATIRGKRLSVSSIYTWFKEDFGGTDLGVIRHLRVFAKPGLRQALAGVDAIDDDAYDWSLNE